MPQRAELTAAHVEAGLGRFGFNWWPVAALRTLRALADGEWRTGKQAAAASEALGERLSYGGAMQGFRFLENPEYIWVLDPRPKLAEAHPSAHPSLVRLNEVGLTYAAISLAKVPPGSVEPAPEPAEQFPPDPVTPLWRVLHDHGETLVVAADRQAALALFERETGEEAHRAEPVDTTAPVVLGWTQREA